jgi:hypothetical protein
MPAKSKEQFRLMQAVAHNPSFAKKANIKPSVGAEYTKSNTGRKSYEKLPEQLKKGGPSLAIGRGEKLPASQGAGLTAKGRAKYNRETGSNLKAPQPEGGPRKDSFCARMRPIAEKSEKGSRARASMRRWKCPGF